jgi:hypothetical protein
MKKVTQALKRAVDWRNPEHLEWDLRSTYVVLLRCSVRRSNDFYMAHHGEGDQETLGS